MQAVLRKLGNNPKTITGTISQPPRKGSIVKIEFTDGMHEYVTTPVLRVMNLVGSRSFFLQTAHSRYQLIVK